MSAGMEFGGGVLGVNRRSKNSKLKSENMNQHVFSPQSAGERHIKDSVSVSATLRKTSSSMWGHRAETEQQKRRRSERSKETTSSFFVTVRA